MTKSTDYNKFNLCQNFDYVQRKFFFFLMWRKWAPTAVCLKPSKAAFPLHTTFGHDCRNLPPSGSLNAIWREALTVSEIFPIKAHFLQ